MQKLSLKTKKHFSGNDGINKLPSAFSAILEISKVQ